GPGGRDAPLMASGRERGLHLHVGKIESAAARPNFVEQACGSDLCPVLVSDFQRPAVQFAAGRAFDADLKTEAFAGRYRGWQTPDVDTRCVRHNRERELSRSLFMQDPVRLLCGEHGPPHMLAQFEWCPQDKSTGRVGLAIARGKFGTRELGVVPISD